MKKNLLATSALVAAGALFSGSALAEAKPIVLKVGGYYEQWVGFISQDSDAAVNDRTNATGLDVQEDGEIHFEGSTTLDNGMTFGVNVQMEASTSGDQIDENYLFVRGSFGEIVLGSENGPAYAMHYGIDNDQGYGLEEGDTAFYWMSSGTVAALHTTRPAELDNDGQKIRLISPRMSGLQVGFSYVPEGRDDADSRIPNEKDNGGTAAKATLVTNVATSTAVSITTTPAVAAVYEDIFAVGVNYDMKFDDVRVRVSAVGEYVGDDNGRATGSETSVWNAAAGLRIGFGGFDVAMSYKHANGAGPANAEQLGVFGAGISYTDGPMGISLTGAYGSTQNNEPGTAAVAATATAAEVAAVAAGRDSNQLVVQLGIGYVIGPGVSVNGTAVYAASSDLLKAGQDFTGFGVVGGVKLNF